MAGVEVRVRTELGRLLATFRMGRGWSQEELAAQSGMSVRAIGDLERGHVRRPRPASIALLAGALGLTDAERSAVAEAVRVAQPAAFVVQPGPLVVDTGGASGEAAVRAGPGDAIVGADGGAPPAPVAPPGLGGLPGRGGPQTAVPGVPAPPGLLASALATPAQLPAAVAALTGRGRQVQELDEVLLGRNSRRAPRAAAAVITGSAGVGKTALAVRWAHRVRDRFPDGQLFADLHGYACAEPVPPVEVLAAFLHALGVPGERVPAGVEEAAGLFRTLLASRQVLVVLDNARSPGQVRPLLPGSPGCRVVITSRDSLAGLVAREGAHHVGLDVLTPGEARLLLARTMGEERVEAEPEAAAELARLCARLPLALRIAAAQLTGHPQPIADYVAELAAGNRLPALEASGDEQIAVRAAFDASYHGLPAGARRLFRLLGLVPGVDLTRDAAAALAGITAGDAAALLARTGLGVPAQLPPDVAAFTGRRAELDAFDKLAVAAEPGNGGATERPLPIGVIGGAAGVGKTGLAVHWSHRAVRRFPDGQLFVNLRGYDPHEEPLAPGAALDRFLRALGVPGQLIPVSLDERTALFRTMLNGRRVLIVLDNARTPEQVRPLLPGSGTCFVLVTSRNRLDGLVAHDGARLCPLGALSRREAAELLKRVCGGLADPVTADRIGTLCDRLPLALRIAAARLSARPYHAVPDLVERLSDEQRRLDELSDGDRGVRVSFGLSYRELPGRAAELLRRLGLLDAVDFAAWMAAALMDATEREAEDLLDQLVRAGLLEPIGADCAGQARYRLHDLMRLFAREHSMTSDPPKVRRGAMSHVLGAALHLAEKADSALGNPFIIPLYGDSPRHKLEEGTLRRVQLDPVTWFEAERTVLVGAVAQACRLGLTGYAWELTSALSQFLSTRRHLDDWQDCTVRSAAAAHAAGDERGEAAVLLQLADRQGDAGRYDDAVRSTSRALALANRSEDTEAVAVCWTVMAFLHREGGKAALAQQDAEHALALLGDPAICAARGRALTALGLSYLDQGRYAAAADCFTRILRIQQQLHSVRGQAEARYRLGTVRLQQGCHTAAARLLTVAMRSASDSGDLMTAMLARIRLGQTFLEIGRLDEARPLLEHAVRHLSAENSPRLRALALDNLGQLHQAQNEPQQAQPLIAEAQFLRRTLNHA